MAISLEKRASFLDHRIAELVWQLPLQMKIRGEESKWALRQVLYKCGPRELIERLKASFGTPIGSGSGGHCATGSRVSWTSSVCKRRAIFTLHLFVPNLLNF